MGKIIRIMITITLFFVVAKPVSAEKVAGHSASMTYNLSNSNKSEDLFKKKLAIKRVLEKYDSDMAEVTDSFINTAVTYDLDPYLLPSIAGLESFFGRFTMPGSYNPFGWGRGLVPFENWEQAIETVGKGIRENYIDKGAQTIDEIGAIYCEGNTWAGKVRFFMDEFKAEEEKIQLLLGDNTVKL
ncbi:hypothetical protein COT62_01180 [Candidatus Roizmanbacteria bacterium CG09_land_8_20_14_0_10_41_9]|uniref:Mannosyl-glycoprotein endo-beta-N-acetylglucosamidase-like domain-containing protein n=1 Tax=Candidatus Roizmanbacteria bacterium CG09_land_8_20_14_0_10_41_9 TaxID=1974850 RepID=A0A2H0WTB2_9BACT|nr:MAG: hypothetical protein COT62_01180 [Candidatus Roizmanbacteria bacterium CG09_land_8_20_14_0_10_41_9]